ncbi:hypothetical protein POM88_034792 [Heracleum sosnowskyi]|uniref:Sugar phosphate transporter domain-containing protein n=1 Tax=Heracleum sosnowskyi TaxID=360622 RepID=A0AAD8MAV5_9APIA|nr:hypothetical protein POM88_034792 [Heracleum sosnowskyi]
MLQKLGWFPGNPVVNVPVAACHTVEHFMSNVSFAAVAVSFTHTIKALEPFFNAVVSQFILDQQISLPLWLSLAPVVISRNQVYNCKKLLLHDPDQRLGAEGSSKVARREIYEDGA